MFLVTFIISILASHVKQGAEIGIAKISELLNRVLYRGLHTRVLLETPNELPGYAAEVSLFRENFRIR